MVRYASDTKIKDAQSGFTISKQAAIQMNVYSKYTYTLETIIQAGQTRLNIISIPIKVNDIFVLLGL